MHMGPQQAIVVRHSIHHFIHLFPIISPRRGIDPKVTLGRWGTNPTVARQYQDILQPLFRGFDTHSVSHPPLYDVAMPTQHRIFGAMDGSNYIWSGKVVIQSLEKDGYTGHLMADGRLETYMDDSLVWTSYFIGADHAEAEFVDTVDMMTGEMFT